MNDMTPLGEWRGNCTIENVSAVIADQERRHGGAYVVGPAHATATKTAEQLAAMGLRGIYKGTPDEVDA